MPEAGPFTLTDEDGGTLRVRRCSDHGHALLCATELESAGGKRASASVCVDSLSILDITRAMHEVTGTEPPVMLGRPDLASARDANGWIAFRGVELRKAADGGVTFSGGGNTETLTAAQARQCAAVAVALADERPEPEPDPADVESLAGAIRARYQPDDTPPTDWERNTARVALRWMHAKGARS